MSNCSEFIRLRIVLPIAEKVKHTCATKWLRQITKMQDWSREQIVDWQNEHLRDFIRHAYNHTQYYHRLFDTLGLTPDDVQSAADLQKLPILTKDMVNAHYAEFVPDNISSIRCRKGKTGGTTGKPMLYLCDENTWGYVTAAKIFYWKKAGWRYGESFVAFGSASLFGKKPSLARRIYDRIRNEVPMNSVNLNDELCAKYAQIIKQRKIHFIYGYAASIYLFAQYLEQHNMSVGNIKAVFTTSENLTDDYRHLMERVFQCHVVDCYGARDAGITGYETSYHHYEVGYNAIVELIDKIDDNTGTAVTTNFLNYSFPLIRYQFGDELSLADSTEYNGQLITQVIGRTADVMRLSNGRNLTATGFSMIMKAFDIVAFDVNKIGDCAVKMRIQPVEDKYSQEQEVQIREAIRRYIGNDCQFEIEYVNQFTALANGKRRYFMNDLSK